MRVFYSLFLAMCITTASMGQLHPIDTLYYENGSVRRIGYEMDQFYTGHSVDRYFEEGSNRKSHGAVIADTLYLMARFTSIVYTRQYFSDGIVLVNRYSTDHPEKRISLPPISVSIRIHGKELISLVYRIQSDSKLKSFQLNIIDSFNHKLKIPMLTVLQKDNPDIYHVNSISLKQYGALYLNYHDLNFVKDIKYQWYKDKLLEAKYIAFYKDYQIKEVGKYFGKMKVGSWKEWHSNGNLKSMGIYTPKYIAVGPGNVKAISVKEGSWYYYTEDGTLSRKEKWKNGKLKKAKYY